MKAILRFAVVATFVSVAWLTTKEADANKPGVGPIYPTFCTEGAPCTVNMDCGIWEGGLPAGACTSHHTCVCG